MKPTLPSTVLARSASLPLGGLSALLAALSLAFGPSLRPAGASASPSAEAAAVAGPLGPPGAPRDAASETQDGAGETPASEAGAAEGEAAALQAADRASIDSLVDAYYDLVAGEAGAREWPRFVALFHPTLGRIRPLIVENRESRLEDWSPNQYARTLAPWLLENGYHPRELDRRSEVFGELAQVASTFASYRSPDDPTPFTRGVLFLQLVHEADGWRILSASWDQEREGVTLDARQLGD